MAGYGYMNRGYTGYTDDWNRKNYGENGYPDQVSRPAVVDFEGRKRPVISYSPNPGSENYITTSTDRIVEYGRPPMEPVRDYGYTNDKWRRSSSPIQDRPQRVDDYITNVQVEASRATRPVFLSNTNWRNPPYSSNNTGYGEYANYRRNDSYPEPAVISQDGWDRERSGRKVWPTPASHDTPLSGPTNDIGKAVEILKDATKTSPVPVATAVAQPWLGTAPASTFPRRDTYTNNPASRYGNFNLSSRPY